MYHVDVLCVGKVGEPYLAQAVQEYEKRLRSFCQLPIRQLREYRLPESPSPSEIHCALAQEEKQILDVLPSRGLLCALAVEGEPLSSEQLASFLKTAMEHHPGGLNFIIGSSYGLSASVKKRADKLLSLSNMTFPHGLARVLLLEQLYRAFHILLGGKYHK